MQVTSRVPLHNKNKKINQIISANMKKKKNINFPDNNNLLKKDKKFIKIHKKHSAIRIVLD